MSRTLQNVNQVADQIRQCQQTAGRRIVVGVSGYCGSGKSTVTRALIPLIPGSIRLRGDDFLDPSRSHRRSADWDGVERQRLATEVLRPFRENRPSSFRRFDWSTRQLGVPEPVPTADILIVDLIGLFHPQMLPLLDLTLWCDTDLETALRQGLHRDELLGRDHRQLWEAVWVPNERAFAAQFSPREQADFLYAPAEKNR